MEHKFITFGISNNPEKDFDHIVVERCEKCRATRIKFYDGDSFFIRGEATCKIV